MTGMLDNYLVSDEERARPYGQQPMEPVIVQMRKHIKAQTNERLFDIFTDFYDRKGRFDYDMPEWKEFVAECEGIGNLTMLMLEVAEEAYMRDILDEDDYIRLQDEG
jgi:hypothetical protein